MEGGAGGGGTGRATLSKRYIWSSWPPPLRYREGSGGGVGVSGGGGGGGGGLTL